MAWCGRGTSEKTDRNISWRKIESLIKLAVESYGTDDKNVFLDINK